MGLRRHIPNSITCLNLACGVAACIMASRYGEPVWGMHGWQWAIVFMGCAAVADYADGFAARLLHAYSALGRELDSLCDCVSFGVAPSLLVYFTMTQAQDGPWWPAWFALLIAVGGALRLARFNIDDTQATTFTGLPIPANAIFWIGVTGWIQVHGYPGPWAMLGLIVLLSWLMVSPIRMFSLKMRNLRWRENVRRYVLLAGAVLFIVTDGLAGLAWTIVLYVLISVLGRRQPSAAA